MDFGLSPAAEEVCARMWGFMREEVFPAEKEYEQWRASHDPHAHPPVLARLEGAGGIPRGEGVGAGAGEPRPACASSGAGAAEGVGEEAGSVEPFPARDIR